MSTPRVPASQVVRIECNCGCGNMIALSTPWLELRELNGYVFSHSPKWKGVAVAILPFRRIVDTPWGEANPRFEFLAVLESRPCHGGGEYISSITGAYDNSATKTLVGCALNEVEEEGGYIIPDQSKVIDLGWVNGSKSSDSVDHLFAVQIDKDAIECKPVGDGSAMEANVKPIWITQEHLIHSNDMFLLSMYTRLRATAALR
jgi:hypothetical protein